MDRKLLDENTNKLILEIAYEAHMMGRIYSSLGEPETPAEVCEDIERMIIRKSKPRGINYVAT